MNTLFDVDNIKSKPEDYEESSDRFVEENVTYDLLKYEGGAFYLTRDGDNANVIIINQFKEHFFDMGERGYLINKALDLYNELKEV